MEYLSIFCSVIGGSLVGLNGVRFYYKKSYAKTGIILGLIIASIAFFI